MTKPIMALDVGDKRIGVAHTPAGTSVAVPLTTLDAEADWQAELRKLCAQHDTAILVVGLPRGLDGQETAQTAKIRDVAEKLKSEIEIPIHFQDEALTSQQAEDALKQTGKDFGKEDIDAVAASMILQDFVDNNQEPNHGNA